MADREWSTVDVEDIAALTAVYGGNPARWPADRRAAAVRALAMDGAAHELVVNEARLDALLSMVAEPEISAARVDGVVAGALARLDAVTAPAAKAAPGKLDTFLPSPFDLMRTALSWLSVRAPQAGWLAGATAAGILVGVMTMPSATLPATETTTAQAGATVETAQADVTDMPSLLFTSYTVETHAQ
ncbi:hypothetical protein [Nitrospirillum viridazoti]|uniref:Uncharacterized protein n=1 Tax=Nitrospirillum viridazoti CBAmc TaxID=1441467 RepID=A0A248JLJ1_9PROT|nr:hypothetical protein [Nitrospirillum amazonense]ASG19597.1 hypothetical protein Y958_01230 [Nitrospirillum amazonense CBAmc]TWB27403.1 hypothetical protein FBZ91_13325 [Nitrospirillum amazonense]